MTTPRLASAVLLVAAISVSAVISRQPSTAAPSSSVGSSDSTGVVAAPPDDSAAHLAGSSAAQLESLLPEPPLRFVRVPDGLDKVGALDLPAVARLYKDPPKTSAALTTMEFEGAFKGSWVTNDDSAVEDFEYIYEFATPKGADTWRATLLLAARLKGLPEPPAPSSVPDAHAYRMTADTTSGPEAQSRVSFVIGRRTFVVGAASRKADVKTLDELASALAVDAHAHAIQVGVA